MILSTDNATQFIEKVNFAFSEVGLNQRLDKSMNAGDIIAQLNLAFSPIHRRIEIVSSMNAGDIIEAVNHNISLMRRTRKTIEFLHISDVHNCADAVNKCKELMDSENNLLFTIFTGDYPMGRSYSNVDSPFKSLGSKILMVTGNHDVGDAWYNNQANATAYMKTVIANSGAVFGDSGNIASYWYKDIQLSSSSKLRIIAVDAYDYRDNVGIGSRYDTIYTQEQVDWIVARIIELRSTDFFIIAMHEPPVNASVANYSYNEAGKMDDNIVALRRSNPFCSARLWVWDTSLTNGNLFPSIVNSYQNKELMESVVTNTNTVSGDVLSSINCNYDFRSVQPATFLCYLCGHLHGDLVEYHPNYPKQLILLVDCGNTSTLGNSSDIGVRATDTTNGVRDNGIFINRISLDFVNNYINITRIGQNAALSYNGFHAVRRSGIRVPFIKKLRR